MRLNNDVRIIGNVGQDPDTGVFQNGNSYIRFSVAINDSYKNKDGEWVEQTVWMKVQAFGTLADRLIKQVTKGISIHIGGKLQANDWVDKEGRKRTDIYVLAEHAKVLPSKDKTANNSRPVSPLPNPDTSNDEVAEEDFLF